MRIKEDGSGLGRSHSYICDAHLSAKPNAKPVAKKETQPALPALTRAGVKDIKKESIRESGTACRMIEVAAPPAPEPGAAAPKATRFRAVLIQEGLGNTKDGYYYTKEALKSAVPIFEGKKFMADHPSSFEDDTRPERSVKDVFGHYENVAYVEANGGTGQLQADLVLLSGEDADKIRDRLVHAVDYAKRYPDKDFLGLSINASGDANPEDAQEFLLSGQVVESAKPKLQQAISEGLLEVKIVKLIDSAVSCDLVTEAGAKGKVLQLLEADKMKHEAKKEAEEKKKEADGAHDDEEQDKQLIMDQLKKHGLMKDDEKDDQAADGDKKDAPAEEPKEAAEEKPAEGEKKEAEVSENDKMMQAAMSYHKAYKEMGHESEAAAERAVEAMKCANMVHAKSQEAEEKKEAEKKEAFPPKKDEEEKKEAKKEAEEKKESVKESETIKLRGENASLKERLAKIETEQYLDKKLQESKLPMSVTKKFKESTKGFKSNKDVDEKFSLFLEGYKAISGEAGSLDFLAIEKVTEGADEGISLDDCVEA